MEKRPTEVAHSLFDVVRRATLAVGLATVMAGVLRAAGKKNAPQTYGGWTDITPELEEYHGQTPSSTD